MRNGSDGQRRHLLSDGLATEPEVFDSKIPAVKGEIIFLRRMGKTERALRDAGLGARVDGGREEEQGGGRGLKVRADGGREEEQGGGSRVYQV